MNVGRRALNFEERAVYAYATIISPVSRGADTPVVSWQHDTALICGAGLVVAADEGPYTMGGTWRFCAETV